ncbi:hypothetical protein PAXINDRAFT_97041 [Paxillus involutus ATCC 200175]|nr:hypothetical protein PAXINDRAFT_97041 [Paxillus involutus ATCC 200175]
MKDQPPDLPPIINSMADNIPYSSTPNGYMTPTSYYTPPHAGGNVHVVAPQPRSEPPQRKRPKYTRSKTGCLTCRVKKIKCDETKPICMRCTHGQRDCTWPEGVPARKKATPRKESLDGRPSTAESSGLSETSTPPTRDSTPPRRVQAEYSLPPVSRRHSEPFVPPLGPDPQAARRQLAHPYQLHHHPSQTNVLSMIPEMPPYHSSQPRYEPAYANAGPSMHPGPRLPGPSHAPSHQVHIRPMGQHQHHPQPQQHWTQPHMLPPVNSMEPFVNDRPGCGTTANPVFQFHAPQERNLVGHSSNDHHPRYQ